MLRLPSIATLAYEGRSNCALSIAPLSWRRKVDLQLRIFNRLSRGIRNLHPIEAGAPEERIEITSQVFRSPRYDDVYRAPSYRAWLNASGFDEGYQFLARFLRHLQGSARPPRRWILKAPEHVFSIDALTRVFPDAKLVFVHRDPGHVLVSAARLTELLRAPFTTAIDRREIGRRVADYWQDGMQRMVKVANDASFPLRSRLVHVQYRSLVSDPIGTVGEIYNAFGLELWQAAREPMTAKVARAPNGGYGANRYRLEEFGINPERERASVYIVRFSIASELAAGLREAGLLQGASPPCRALTRARSTGLRHMHFAPLSRFEVHRVYSQLTQHRQLKRLRGTRFRCDRSELHHIDVIFQALFVSGRVRHPLRTIGVMDHQIELGAVQ